MSDYISKSKLLERLKNDDSLKHARKLIRFYVEEAPTVDVAPITHAHWKNRGYLDQCCSNCGESPEQEQGETPPDYDICPYCGAVMDESEETE